MQCDIVIHSISHSPFQVLSGVQSAKNSINCPLKTKSILNFLKSNKQLIDHKTNIYQTPCFITMLLLIYITHAMFKFNTLYNFFMYFFQF